MPNFEKAFDYTGWPETYRMENHCVAIGFDPGGTTGYAALGVLPECLTDARHGDLHNYLAFVEYGEIDCSSQDVEGWRGTHEKHAGLNIMGENAGIADMVAYSQHVYPNAVIVVEDFIPDPGKFDQARHTLSPVRLMAGFSFGMSCIRMDDGRLGDERIFVQNRSLAKTTITNDRLAGWKMNDASSEHARDAVKHALYFLRDCRGESQDAAYKRHLAWPHLFTDPADSTWSFVANKRVPRKPKPKGERI